MNIPLLLFHVRRRYNILTFVIIGSSILVIGIYGIESLLLSSSFYYYYSINENTTTNNATSIGIILNKQQQQEPNRLQPNGRHTQFLYQPQLLQQEQQEQQEQLPQQQQEQPLLLLQQQQHELEQNYKGRIALQRSQKIKRRNYRRRRTTSLFTSSRNQQQQQQQQRRLITTPFITSSLSLLSNTGISSSSSSSATTTTTTTTTTVPVTTDPATSSNGEWYRPRHIHLSLDTIDFTTQSIRGTVTHTFQSYVPTTSNSNNNDTPSSSTTATTTTATAKKRTITKSSNTTDHSSSKNNNNSHNTTFPSTTTTTADDSIDPATTSMIILDVGNAIIIHSVAFRTNTSLVQCQFYNNNDNNNQQHQQYQYQSQVHDDDRNNTTVLYDSTEWNTNINYTIVPISDIVKNAMYIPIPCRGGNNDKQLVLPYGTIIQIQIEYSTQPNNTELPMNNNEALTWLQPTQTANGDTMYLYSISEMIVAREWIPLMDTPQYKCTYSADIVVMNHYQVYMSAYRTNVQSYNSTHTQYFFEQPTKVPSYLIAIIVGSNIQEHYIVNNTISIITESSMMEDAVYEFELLLPHIISLLESYIQVPYPFGKCTLVIMPPAFAIGGMEHPLLTYIPSTVIIGDRSRVYESIHEMIHAYFGNYITCATWDSFWLNEGFTTFLQRKVSEYEYSTDYRNMEYIIANQTFVDIITGQNPITYTNDDYEARFVSSLYPNTSHYDNPMNIFTDCPYEKGSQFLFYIETLLGPTIMQQFVHRYVTTFAEQSITTNDFYNLYVNFLQNHSDITNATAILQATYWDTWIYGIGVTPIDLHFQSTLLTDAQQLATSYVRTGQSLATTINTATFTSTTSSSSSSTTTTTSAAAAATERIQLWESFVPYQKITFLDTVSQYYANEDDDDDDDIGGGGLDTEDDNDDAIATNTSVTDDDDDDDSNGRFLSTNTTNATTTHHRRPPQVTKVLLEWIDNELNLTYTRDPDLRTAWYILAIETGYFDTNVILQQLCYTWLGQQGDGSYTSDIYEALVATQSSTSNSTNISQNTTLVDDDDDDNHHCTLAQTWYKVYSNFYTASVANDIHGVILYYCSEDNSNTIKPAVTDLSINSSDVTIWVDTTNEEDNSDATSTSEDADNTIILSPDDPYDINDISLEFNTISEANTTGAIIKDTVIAIPLPGSNTGTLANNTMTNLFDSSATTTIVELTTSSSSTMASSHLYLYYPELFVSIVLPSLLILIL